MFGWLKGLLSHIGCWCWGSVASATRIKLESLSQSKSNHSRLRTSHPQDSFESRSLFELLSSNSSLRTSLFELFELVSSNLSLRTSLVELVSRPRARPAACGARATRARRAAPAPQTRRARRPARAGAGTPRRTRPRLEAAVIE